MNTPELTKSLGITRIKDVVDRRVTPVITDYSYVQDKCTLSNGIQVGRLSGHGMDSYNWSCVLVGNLKLNPTGPYGKAALTRLYGCLCPEDCTIVAKIVYKVQMEYVSSGKECGWKLG